jgi:hypothetical protein
MEKNIYDGMEVDVNGQLHTIVVLPVAIETGARGSIVIMALCYILEGHEFDSR